MRTDYRTATGILLTYIKNNKGLRIDPCDTPHDIKLQKNNFLNLP